MNKIEVYRKNNRIVKFVSKGHAGYAEHGEDIVCSAVSVLTQTAIMGLTQIANIKVSYKLDEEKAYLVCRLPDNITELESIKADAILETMYLGLKNIALNYRKHISLLDKEEV